MDISALFVTRLPRRPYCADALTSRLLIRDADAALQYRYIQPNPPLEASWIILDLTYPEAELAWQKARLPPPTMSVADPTNGHAHIYYGLKTPVGLSNLAREAPIRYAAAIQAAYRTALAARPSHDRVLARNPLHPHWRVQWHPALYELAELAQHVTLTQPRPDEVYDWERNGIVFDALRCWAYQWIRHYRQKGASTEQWYAMLLAQAKQMNTFAPPLPPRELRSIAKGIAEWTWQHLTEAGFKQLQSERGKLGGRPKTTTRDGKPWELAGISRATYYRRRAHVEQEDSMTGDSPA